MAALRWFLLLLLLVPGCQNATSAKKTLPSPKTYFFKHNQVSEEEVLAALLRARPGDTFLFSEGTFEFTQGLSLTVEDVTIRGKGMDKTVLSFKHQASGSVGLSVNRNGFTLEDLSLDDAKGDALKVQDAEGVILRRVQARWNGEAKASNGPYGLYPVQCKNVLIEDCVAIGAADAGIYVGQSTNVIVRRCRAERNVAGIEIENCIDADVFENIATNNAGGILVFDLPGLQVKNGRRVRVFDNEVIANNHANFAPAGTTVSSIPSGTGIVVVATDEVEIFKNHIRDHNTSSVNIASYHILGKPLQDKEYDPIPEGVSLHDNEITGGGQKPGGMLGMLLLALVGKPIPDILYDGVVNPARMVDGKLPAQFGVSIRNNGPATFANLHWDQLDPKLPLRSKDKITRDLTPHHFELPALPAVAMRGCK
jgi:parallel beta-helix repeat protein